MAITIQTDSIGPLVQFVGPDGTRRKIRLGSLEPGDAEIFVAHLNRLLRSVRRQRAISQETQNWIDSLGDQDRSKLINYGLIRPLAATQLDHQANLSVKTEILLIGPHEASAYLTKNVGNRPWNLSYVQFLTRQMENNEWVTNGDPIRFDKNGNLIDGQHRLKAIVASGKSFLMVVITGLEPTCFETIDIGRRRSGADTLAVYGCKNCTALAAAAHVLLNYKNGMTGVNPRHGSSNTIVRQIVEKHPGLEQAASWASNKKQNFPLRIGIATCFKYLTSLSLFGDKSNTFFDLLATGELLERTSPIYVLRERLNQVRRTSTHLIRRETEAAFLVKSFNAYATGKSLKILKFAEDEEFPKIVGLNHDLL